MVDTESMQHFIRDRVSVQANTECWIWRLRLNDQGYARTDAFGYLRAHRLSFEAFRGPIPTGLTIDHLCRVKACVNPQHLEPVTNSENMRRRWALSSLDVQTTCRRGHALVDNAYTDSQGRQRCRSCRRDSQRDYARRSIA